MPSILWILGLFTLIDVSFAGILKGPPRATTPQVDLGYEVHTGFLNVRTSSLSSRLILLTVPQTTGNFYNFSNIPYAAPPVGNLRFINPQPHPTPSPKPTNDGSRYAICPQGIPAWTAVATQWLTEGIDTLNISAGYTPPTITTNTPQAGSSEDCLLLDVMVPKAIFDNKGTGSGAPV